VGLDYQFISQSIIKGMIYLLIIAILFSSELLYFRIADRFNIIDKPNERGMQHRLVSTIYFVVQLACSALIIAFYPTLGWGIFALLAVILVAIYGFKFKLMK